MFLFTSNAISHAFYNDFINLKNNNDIHLLTIYYFYDYNSMTYIDRPYSSLI